MPKVTNKKIGDLGEKLACKFLIKKGFRILEKNYSKKFGEIDIIAKKRKSIYFFEVKTNTVKFKSQNTDRPEDRVDRRKLRQIGRVIQVYLQEKNLTESDWYFRVIAILFNPKQKTARLKIIEDVVPE